MSIIVIDQSPELYWFVSNALLQYEIPLKHIQTLQAGERNILQELPQVVILNGDDKSLCPEEFINSIRNHVFARNTLFIVVTANTSPEFKKALLISGASQVFYRGRGHSPSPKFFASLVKWLLNKENPDPLLFDYLPVAFPAEAEFTCFGRIGWISPTHCMIECNLNLNVGQSIDIKNTLFDELEIKNVKLECLEINKVGRYYQYANSLYCKIRSKNPAKDPAKIKAWITANIALSKHKPIKVVYFENEPEYREEIKKMIKTDKRYCARGYNNLTDILEILKYQLPNLLLINRVMIQKDKAKFEAIKSFLKANFCYCVTYANSELVKIEEFKKNYEFAMHSPTPIDLPLLESMVQKLEFKLPEHLKTNETVMYFNKHSAYSRLTLHSPCILTEIAVNGAGVELPFLMSNFGVCEISSNSFGIAKISRSQFFRSFLSKPSTSSSKGIYHRLVFIGQTVNENELIKEATELLSQFGFEKWLKGETHPEDSKIKKA